MITRLDGADIRLYGREARFTVSVGRLGRIIVPAAPSSTRNRGVASGPTPSDPSLGSGTRRDRLEERGRVTPRHPVDVAVADPPQTTIHYHPRTQGVADRLMEILAAVRGPEDIARPAPILASVRGTAPYSIPPHFSPSPGRGIVPPRNPAEVTGPESSRMAILRSLLMQGLPPPNFLRAEVNEAESTQTTIHRFPQTEGILPNPSQRAPQNMAAGMNPQQQQLLQQHIMRQNIPSGLPGYSAGPAGRNARPSRTAAERRAYRAARSRNRSRSPSPYGARANYRRGS